MYRHKRERESKVYSQCTYHGNGPPDLLARFGRCGFGPAKEGIAIVLVSLFIVVGVHGQATASATVTRAAHVAVLAFVVVVAVVVGIVASLACKQAVNVAHGDCIFVYSVQCMWIVYSVLEQQQQQQQRKEKYMEPCRWSRKVKRFVWRFSRLFFPFWWAKRMSPPNKTAPSQVATLVHTAAAKYIQHTTATAHAATLILFDITPLPLLSLTTRILAVQAKPSVIHSFHSLRNKKRGTQRRHDNEYRAPRRAV